MLPFIHSISGLSYIHHDNQKGQSLELCGIHVDFRIANMAKVRVLIYTPEKKTTKVWSIARLSWIELAWGVIPATPL